MWKNSDYDHTLIQTTVVGVDGFEPDDKNSEVELLAFSTSYVMENYVRPKEYAIFGSELRVEADGGYQIKEVTQVLAKGIPDARAIFLRCETFFLGSDFKSCVEGVVMNEVSRHTVREFIVRNNKNVRSIE